MVYQPGSRRQVSDEERREFLKALGVTAGAAVAGTSIEELTLQDLQGAVTVEAAGELAERGETISSDLAAPLDAGLLETELAGVAGAIEELPAVREAGIPELGESLYGELTGAAWRIDDHLVDTGFYASAEAHLPPFTADHIESTTKQLIESDAVAPILSEIGFDEQTQFALVAGVVNRVDHLAMWQPTWILEHEAMEEIQAEHVEPLHRRAAAGALDWIDGLDKHLVQREVLITEEMLDAGVGDVQAMLGGFYLLSAAAEALARGDVGDAELTALITGSTGILITSQIDFQYDLVRITEDMRAPRGEV